MHRPPRGEADSSGNCSLSDAGLRVEFAPRMSRRIRIFQVDAFTTDRFTGNPAGVVLDADSLNDAEMLAIARELNNADTAFVLKPDGADHDLRVRFFTPRTEASFVGHATVATHFVLSRDGAPAAWPTAAACASARSRGSSTSKCAAKATRAASRCASRRRRSAASSTIASVSRCSTRSPYPPATSTRVARCASSAARARACMIGVRSTEQLKQLKPDYSRLTTLSAQLGAAGFFVFTLSHGLAGCLTESRMFCPALGIPEDPVSGNAHGLLGAYLAEQGLLPHDGRHRAVHRRAGPSRASCRPRRRRARIQRRASSMACGSSARPSRSSKPR